MRLTGLGTIGRNMRLFLAHEPLRGSFVSLVPLERSHTATLWDAAQRMGGTGFLTLVPKSMEETAHYVGAALAAKEAGTALPFVVFSTASKMLVGSTRLANIEKWDVADARTNVADVAEIGWTWLSEDAQRTGINTEAKLFLLTHAFEILGVGRVTLKTDVRNTQSRAGIERIGAKFEGVLRRHLPAVDGGPRDTAMYSIIAPEWAKVRADLVQKLARGRVQ